MPQIAAGLGFGQEIVDPVSSRWKGAAPALVLVDGVGRMADALDRQGQAQEREALARQEAQNKARALRISTDAEFDLSEAQVDIAEQARAGKLSSADAVAEFRKRADEIGQRRLQEVPGDLRDVTAETLQARSRRFESQLGGALRQNERDQMRADLGTALTNLAALSGTGRAGAISSAQSVLAKLGPAAGMGPDDIQRELAAFRVKAATNEASLALFEARGDAAAIDAVAARLTTAEFGDLTPEARLHLRQQADARKQHLEHEAAAAANRAQAVQNALELDLYGKAQLQIAQSGRVDPELWIQLKDGHRASLIHAQRAEARARAADAAGRSIKTDFATYLDLRELALNEPTKFAALDLKQYMDRIGPAQLEQLADLKGKKVTELGKAPRDAVSLQQQLTATMQSLKITKPADRGRFMSYVQTEIDAETQAAGKPLTFVQRQAVIDRALLQGDDPDAWLFGTKRMYELKPEQRARFKPYAATDAPATVIDALNDALRQQGLPQTPANRLSLYQRAMQKGTQ